MSLQNLFNEVSTHLDHSQTSLENRQVMAACFQTMAAVRSLTEICTLLATSIATLCRETSQLADTYDRRLPGG